MTYTALKTNTLRNTIEKSHPDCLRSYMSTLHMALYFYEYVARTDVRIDR